MAAKNIDEILHPKIEPFKTGMLEVSKLHTVYWEISGNPKGKPVIVLHGGPGGASQAEYRRYFDPEAFQIIQMDQRGCGKSTPHAELEDNNSQALIEDIEKLRKFLGSNSTLFEIFIFCPKIQLWFPEKIVDFLGWKTREIVVVLDFLSVDNFDFTRKIVKKLLGEKLVKMLRFCQNWMFGQKFDFQNSVENWNKFIY